VSSFIQSNGVQLGFVRTKSLAQEPVQLGPDYAAQRYLVTWEVTISRLTLGTAIGGGDPAGVRPTDPTGLQAFVRLHDQLMQPRGSLRVRLGTTDVVNIPAQGDVELGPKPLKLVVLGFNGEGSLVCEYTIQYTLRNPCPDAEDLPYLAHVWKAEDEIDNQFFMTRTYTGVLHLNPQVVGVQSDAHPDTIRSLYLPPRTPLMHRESLQVRTLEDGYTIAYRVVDRQPQAFCNSRFITRIEADHQVDHNIPSVSDAATVQADLWQLRIDEILRASGFAPGKDGGAVSFVSPALTLLTQVQYIKQVGLKRLALEQSARGIPTVTHTITATAFGTPDATYSGMSQAARVVCIFRATKGALFNLEAQETLAHFGGTFHEHDRTHPKSVQCVLRVTRRPPVITHAPDPDPAFPLANLPIDGRAQGIWNAGKNQMPTLQGNALQNQDITGPNNEPVPASVRQLVYGGMIHTGRVHLETGWGWHGAAFAPDLLSSRDAGVRRENTMTRGNDPFTGATLQSQLLAAIQDVCARKEVAVFEQRALRT
jgi:hypothetical protein